MSKIDFKNRVAIVTGAGGGLGRDYALEIARRGGAVVVNDLGGNVAGEGRSTELADNVVAEIRKAGGRAVASYDSVTNPEGAERIADAALTEFGRIDVLINNAGNLRNAFFGEFDLADRDALIAVHLLGTWNTTKAVWPHMLQAEYGRIVFVSSNAGIFGNQTQTGYAAAKGGVVGFMNALAQEGRAHNILCNAILPNAASRMAEKMIPEEMLPLVPYIEQMGNSLQPSFVTPMVAYLASEACLTTRDIYSVLGGRLARVVIAVTEGWVGPREEPLSVEDVVAHIDQIRDEKRGLYFPISHLDEFRIVAEQISAGTK